jgi:hypothetical protein
MQLQYISRVPASLPGQFLLEQPRRGLVPLRAISTSQREADAAARRGVKVWVGRCGGWVRS